ncbi:unnamed protein product [Spodoptera littoralis]|uniref:Gustatory receptor n=1 Tax=Spodoptera littoralis TaxID=7109 RepID=A0A9P0I830_SPOLI|nr:unnamed protein product [Spodoptera littoralis]CAH1643207.1 unnamed protein product [Spodoptera littoralis]
MSKANYGQFLRNTNLILPKQPNHDEFLMVMENVFRCSCFIGVLGVKKWICYVWSAFILFVLLVMESQAIWKVIKALGGWAIDTAGQRSVTARLAGTIFYTIAIISLILASKLFRSWEELSALWVRVERVMAVKVPSDGTLKRRMYFIIGFMTVCSLLEHLLSIVSAIGLDCPSYLIIKRYILISHGFMILRLLWASVKTEATKVYTWRKLREAYVKQAMLVRKVDDAIGGIIILSCFCNFYFICLQLFLGITQSQSSEPLRTVYYFTSLGWLCFRVIIVVLAASDINVHSQIALNHIYTHDTLYYNVEDFLDTMEKVFHWSCIFGVFGSKRYISILWSALILASLVVIEYLAIWKVIRAVTGVARDTSGHQDYSEWFAMPLILVSTLASLLWNFQDQLIVLISIGLTSRYYRLNGYVAKLCEVEKYQTEFNKKSEALKVYTWHKIREAYVKQAMQGLSTDVMTGIYYVVSLVWLCTRVISVVLSASGVNTHSKTALKYLYTYETHCYNVEVGRLQDQLTKDYIALSGMGFFYLNKTILLQDFLPILNNVFKNARYFGISGYGFNLSFAWSLVLFTMLVVAETVAVWKVVRFLGGWLMSASDNGFIGRMSGAIFYANALISLFLSSKFVHSWRNLYIYWLSTETNTALKFPPDVRTKKRAILIIVFVISVASKDYSAWNGIPIFILSKLATVLWNFQDLIIILISMGLSSRYKRLNLYVRKIVTVEKRSETKPKFGTELYLQIQVWRRLREAYVRQSTLVRMVDRKLGSLVLLSNINNLYFICLQIYLGIHKPSSSTISRCYFLFSLSWLILRACSVVIAASDVHLHSQRALKLLHSCPSANYNIERIRVTDDTPVRGVSAAVGLVSDIMEQNQSSEDGVQTTLQASAASDELVDKVAAAILKYELVLIQYDK